MKVLQFTLPVAHENSVIVQEDIMAAFYPYLHRHHEAQLMWIQEGEGTLLAGTAMHPFKPGDIFMLGANQPHLFKSNPEYFAQDSNRQSRSTMIFFDPNGKLEPLFSLPEMTLLRGFIQQYAGGFKIPAAMAPAVFQQILAIREAGNVDKLTLFLQLLKTLYLANNELTPLSDVSTQQVSESEGIRIGHIYNYLMQRYDTAISLEAVAAEAHMTPQAFCRYFKKHTGQTLVTFLNRLRVNEACKKLTTSQTDGIATVAYTCGFNSLTNFNRTFKSIMGTSPRQYLDGYKAKVAE
ncbi:helix-turn-helix transcriptional regulator [Mucilaginibacter mali]|uniref:Helix-turn-helix transcriptional regulator n=1 Tax=Mucilaginibacter mali TaxID=2740462 RepID=A0A7D4UPV0_9SPHI|nr:AraC family transcriptional regulator [Mucilaginibacter mali]QKJ31180.1 helix-turn-helix transcriptional regulator [Mucilaginibacter mali]